jgi:hypothetical protein
MAIRYICLDDKYLLSDPEWSYRNDGSDQCYVKAEEYVFVRRALEDAQNQIRMLEQKLSETYK